MEIRQPEIVTDGGPWALHDQACAVCRSEHAILDIGTGRFHPCGSCQSEGWELRQRRSWWWRALVTRRG